MNFKNIALAALLTVFLAMPAYAMDLQSARSAGYVGENLDGYVVALTDRDDVFVLVDDINEKRRAEYKRISVQNGQTVSVVGKVAAEKIINRLDPGSYYQGAVGSWKRR